MAGSDNTAGLQASAQQTAEQQTGAHMAQETAGGALVVIQAGPQALVQDQGRFGVRHLGVTQGGALDWVSLGWANWLLGNAPTAAGLEVAVGGLTLEAQSRLTLALAGADLSARLDDTPIAPYTHFVIEAGQQLVFERPRHGLRAYLALPGGVAATPVMGSLASVMREQLGGLDGQGRALAKGDRLVARHAECRTRRLDTPPDPVAAGAPLALVTGAQIAHFDGSSLFDAFNRAWQVDSRADRMGVRLTGPVLRCRLGGMISEGIPLGAVQVPPDGQPIVLLNDRQTVGGYPRLGALSPLACARLAQCQPGDSVRFAAVTPQRARRDYLAQLARWQ